jgi:hypothetical protein
MGQAAAAGQSGGPMGRQVMQQGGARQVSGGGPPPPPIQQPQQPQQQAPPPPSVGPPAVGPNTPTPQGKAPTAGQAAGPMAQNLNVNAWQQQGQQGGGGQQPNQQVSWQQGQQGQGQGPQTQPLDSNQPYTPPSTQHPEWFDTSISPEQWQAWEKEKMPGCPPNMPYKGRAGQCASKPDDCPEGMQVVGNDAAGNARCVPSNALPGQGGGGGAGPSATAPPGYNQNQLIPGTNAPQLGYYGAMGNMGNLIQAIMALSQGGGQ